MQSVLRLSIFAGTMIAFSAALCSAQDAPALPKPAPLPPTAPVAPVVQAPLDPGLEIIQRWLGTNSNVATLRINFTQTRTMKSIKVPIRQHGSLWLDYRTGLFRWQTGDPPQTIVTKHGNDIIIIRVPGEKFEVRPAGSGASPGMAALAGGFPKSLGEFQQKYRLLEVRQQDKTYRIKTQPLGAGGRGIGNFTFVIESDRYRLLGIEVDLEDGSSLHTVFDSVELNAPITPGLFTPDLTGYKQTEF